MAICKGTLIMNNLLSVLSSTLNSDTINEIGQQIGAPAEQTRGAINAALPTLMGMMANNSRSKQGGEALARAVQKDHAGGGLLDQAQNFIRQGNIGNGEAILGHVLGSRQGSAEQQLASKTGLSSGQTHQLLGLLAPLVMGALGKQTQAEGGASASNVTSLLQDSLGSLMEGSGGAIGSQVLGSLLGGNQKGGSSGLAQTATKLLGGLFRK